MLLFKTKKLDKRNGKPIHANKLITKATNNLNRIKSVKYDAAAQKKKKKSLAKETFRGKYNSHRP